MKTRKLINSQAAVISEDNCVSYGESLQILIDRQEIVLAATKLMLLQEQYEQDLFELNDQLKWAESLNYDTNLAMQSK
jgi:hypothetical protein